MSARMMRKVLKEQEAALQLQKLPPPPPPPPDVEEDSDSPHSPPPARNYFDLLEDEGADDHSSSEHQEKGEIVNETLDYALSSKHSSIEKDVNTVPLPNVKSKKKKKKKAGKNYSSIPENGGKTSNLLFENLTLGATASTSGHQLVAPNPAKLKLVNTDSNDTMQKKQGKCLVLEVDPKFLSAENELRRIFGNTVVREFEKSNSSINSRLVHGGRRGIHNLKKTILVSPSQHWPRWDGSLSMELLETRDGVHYFRYVHSASSTHAQRAFEAAKAAHDLNGIGTILLNHPYHIESLLTLAEYFKFTGEHQISADSIAKCLYAMECAWHSLFTPGKNCQLKHNHDTNKPFFYSLFIHMKNMDKRGCHRSALEICKLLLSLDSDDPMGAMHCIDYYSLRAGEYAWLELFAKEYEHDNLVFPNFSFSMAVCRFYLERDKHGNSKTTGENAASSDLMKQALMLHPSVLKKLVDKVPLKERKWGTVLKNDFFGVEKKTSPSLNHLIAIYVERSYLIWRLPELQSFLYDSAISVIEMVEKEASEVDDWACVRKEAFSSENNEYSHLLVSDFSDSVATMPPEFMVERREQMAPLNVVEDHQQNFEALNPLPLAVLYESMLPWANYGSGDGDGEGIQDDLPENGNE